MAWLKTMSDRGDVDYTTIQEVFKQTHDVSRNLGVVSQIIVAIAVTVATGGSGAAALTAIGTTATATTAAMATAAIASASTMVATASINSGLNGEGLKGTYDRLNNDSTWKNLATSVITAGVTSGISSQLSATTINPVTGLPVASNGLNTLAGAKNLLVLNLANAGASAGINTAINGGSFGDNLRTSLTAAVANTVGAIGFNASADSLTLGWERGVGHALVGATIGYVVGGDSESALAGAAGAIASYGISNGLGNAGLSNDQLSGLAQVGGVLTSTLVTGDGDYAATGQSAANLEFQYNYLSHREVEQKVQLGKEVEKCGSSTSVSCMAMHEALNKLIIEDGYRDYMVKNACRMPSSADCKTAMQKAIQANQGIDPNNTFADPRYKAELQHERLQTGNLVADLQTGIIRPTTLSDIDPLAVRLAKDFSDGLVVVSGDLALAKLFGLGVKAYNGLGIANEAQATTKIVNSIESVVSKTIKPTDSVFVTDINEAVFWSGRSNGIGGPNIACNIANGCGGKTLEMLMLERGIKLPTWDATNPAVVREWQNASLSFARNAKGNVTAILGENIQPKSIWNTIELPALKNNPDVMQITTIDPATGLKTIIFRRGN